MKILLDFFALILFFTVYFISRDIYTATGVAIAAGVVQAVVIFWKNKRLDMMQAVSLGLIVVFGGATILLHNPVFIQWKPSLLFWAMSLALVVGMLMKKNILQTLMGKEISLPDPVWQKLSHAWAVFFFLLGAINLFVAYQYSEEVWVTYKAFGSTGLMIIFFIAQAIYMAKYLPQEDKSQP